jgi:AcrR family transcriptional regulator
MLTSVTNKRSLGNDGRRRSEILGAARRLFAERGYHGTSVRDIAAALDLQGGSLYAHIESKQDLLWELVSSAAERFVHAAAAIAREEPEPRRRLTRLMDEHVAIITADPHDAAVFHHEWRFLPPERREAIARQRRAYEGLFRDAIDEGMARGDFAVRDPKFATLLPLSLGNWLYEWYRTDGALSPRQIADEFNYLVERALGGPCDGRRPGHAAVQAAPATWEEG